MLGWFNKAAGLVFGVLRSALVIGVILLLFDTIDKDMDILFPVLSPNQGCMNLLKFRSVNFAFFRGVDEGFGNQQKRMILLEEFKDGLKK